MKEFPSILRPDNKEAFSKLNYDRIKCYLRRDLYEHIIAHSEGEYFSIDAFNEKRVGSMDMVKKMVGDLIPELEKLGWSCKTSFGGTGLFIYSTEKPPPNCFEDSEELS